MLQRRQILVEAVPDFMGEENEGLSGKHVSVPGFEESTLFLFRRVPSLRAGWVHSRNEAVELHPHSPVGLGTWQGETAILELVISTPPPHSATVQTPAKVLLRHGGREQVLLVFKASFERGEYVGNGAEGSLLLMWVGDLNGDGRADFILDLTDHYNVRMPTLFLSQGGRRGPLVVPVAQHRSVGC